MNAPWRDVSAGGSQCRADFPGGFFAVARQDGPGFPWSWEAGFEGRVLDTGRTRTKDAAMADAEHACTVLAFGEKAAVQS